MSSDSKSLLRVIITAVLLTQASVGAPDQVFGARACNLRKRSAPLESQLVVRHPDAVFANYGDMMGEPNQVYLGDGSGGFICSNVSPDELRSAGVALGSVVTRMIFEDSFESGGTSIWTLTVP